MPVEREYELIPLAIISTENVSGQSLPAGSTPQHEQSNFRTIAESGLPDQLGRLDPCVRLDRMTAKVQSGATHTTDAIGMYRAQLPGSKPMAAAGPVRNGFERWADLLGLALHVRDILQMDVHD